MKRTKSMRIENTVESRELEEMMSNSSDLWCQNQYNAIYDNLKRKVIKGVYDAEKAIDAVYHLAESVTKVYERDFGYRFTVTERFTAAANLSVEMHKMILEEING